MEYLLVIVLYIVGGQYDGRYEFVLDNTLYFQIQCEEMAELLNQSVKPHGELKLEAYCTTKI